MTFGKYTLLCNHHHRQDIEQTRHSSFSRVRWQSVPSLYPESLATIKPFSLPLVLPFKMLYKWNHTVI